MRNLAIAAVLLGLAFFVLSMPARQPPFEVPQGDAAKGAIVAIAAGCASCHGENFAGGDEYLTSPFGNFVAPNITPAHYNATKDEFALALLRGVNQEGKHLYPAFPYSSYATMTPQDVGDLYAYIASLAPVEAMPDLSTDVPFYARWRRVLGLWKKLRAPHPADPDRGAYLVETLGHCQECHTPRTLWGTLRYSKAFEGGKIYNEKGKVAGLVPSLVSGESATWSESEIASYLSDGFTPEFDTAGGAMVEVIENTSQLSNADRDAIAAYIVSKHQE